MIAQINRIWVNYTTSACRAFSRITSWLPDWATYVLSKHRSRMTRNKSSFCRSTMNARNKRPSKRLSLLVKPDHAPISALPVRPKLTSPICRSKLIPPWLKWTRWSWILPMPSLNCNRCKKASPRRRLSKEKFLLRRWSSTSAKNPWLARDSIWSILQFLNLMLLSRGKSHALR